MGHVILIGGSPMAGKSTAAVELASKLKWPCVSTDDIGAALQTVVPINPMQGQDYRDYYADTPQRQLQLDTLQYHKALEPAIKRLIEDHSTWGNSIVMEGWALYPDAIAPLCNENVSSVWLIAGEGLLETRMRDQSNFLDGKAAQQYLLRSKWHNDFLLAQCKAHNARYIVVDGSESPELLAAKVLKSKK